MKYFMITTTTVHTTREEEELGAHRFLIFMYLNRLLSQRLLPQSPIHVDAFTLKAAVS